MEWNTQKNNAVNSKVETLIGPQPTNEYMIPLIIGTYVWNTAFDNTKMSNF